jgi:O-antigen/teichoic acid export membrane protein
MLGYYSLAGTLASVPLMLATPVGLAIFPRLTGLVAVGERDAVTALYHRACSLVSIVVLPCALTFLFFSDRLLLAWTGSTSVAREVGATTSLLLAGQIMQAITVIPFYLALAYGQTRLIVRIQLGGVLVIIPLLIILVSRVGLLGAGVAWLAMNVCTLFPYMYLLHRRFLHGELKTWVRRDVGRPLAASLVVALAGRWLLPLPTARVAMVAVIGLVWVVSATAAALSVPEWRWMLVRQARQRIPAR